MTALAQDVQTPAPHWPAPETVAEAIAALHLTATALSETVERWVQLVEDLPVPPEMHTVVINDTTGPFAGLYQVPSRGRWEAKSIGVLNPGSAPVYIGVGDQSANAAARVPSCPGNGAVVLPILARNLMLGCDPAILGSNTAVVFVFRYLTPQPLSLSV